MVETFVITCNDSVEHVFIGNAEDATTKMELLASEHYQQNEAIYQEQSRQFKMSQNAYQYYRQHTHWAARLTPFTRGSGVIVSAENRHG